MTPPVQTNGLGQRQVRTAAPNSIPKGYKSRNVITDIGIIALVALVYFGAAKLGLSLAIIHANVSPVWPPTGVAIAAVLLFGYRMWPGLFVGAFAANVLLTPAPVVADVLIAVGNTLEAICAALLLERVGFHRSLDRAKDVFKFVVVTMISTMVSATFGSLTLC